MAGAIAVQQHDDVVNLSTISHKKTGYRFAFGKYVIQVSLWHLFGERSSISNQPSLYCVLRNIADIGLYREWRSVKQII